MPRQKTEADEYRIQRDDLAMFVRRLLHATRVGADLNALHRSRLRERIQDYLKRNKLEGSVIRIMED